MVWIKRDDCTGLAGGGNKARKLEFLIGAAIAARADTLVTAGAIQSNHARQVAAVAAKFGFCCSLVITDSVAEFGKPYRENGNFLISQILGAEIHEVGNVDSAAVMQLLAEQFAVNGQRPFVIPIGGSNAIGTLAYVEAFFELQDEFASLNTSFDHIILASGSGGTQAGLALGAQLAAWPGKVLGISVGAEQPRQQARVQRVKADTCAELGALEPSDAPSAVLIDDRFVGPGYGRPANETIEAIRLVAETEGVLLDPVYSGKAMAGLIENIRSGKFRAGENVVFWHTGGSPALSAYPEYFKKGGNNDRDYK